MKYESRVTCFLDLLGFQNHINSTIDKDGNDKSDKIQNIFDALMHIRDILDIEKSEDLGESEKITQFSDCIVISFLSTEESGVFWTLLKIQWLLMNLVSRGILCRGGISYGKLIHTDKVVFGPALVEAYKMESEAANYPRVILHDSIVEVGGEFCADHHTPEVETDYIHNILVKDLDGMYYIDFLEKAQDELDNPVLDFPDYLQKISKIIREGKDHKNPGIRIKYNWLKEKYNNVVAKYQSSDLKWNDSDIENAYKALPLF